MSRQSSVDPLPHLQNVARYYFRDVNVNALMM
jgi:hypothetical protein